MQPLHCNGCKAKMGVSSARFFTESISKPLHLTNRSLYMGAEMGRAFPIFPLFSKVIKAVFGRFPRFFPRLPFGRGCGVLPIIILFVRLIFNPAAEFDLPKRMLYAGTIFVHNLFTRSITVVRSKPALDIRVEFRYNINQSEFCHRSEYCCIRV